MATKVLVEQNGTQFESPLGHRCQKRVIKIIVTNGTKVDCKVAFTLIKDIKN